MKVRRSRLPARSTGRNVTSRPLRARSLHTSNTAGCSTAVVTMWRRLGFARTVPKMAVLLLSVAQEVKRISEGSTPPRKRATVSRPRLMAWAAGEARSYIELGLKYSAAKYGTIASRTSGATAVVALLSR